MEIGVREIKDAKLLGIADVDCDDCRHTDDNAWTRRLRGETAVDGQITFTED